MISWRLESTKTRISNEVNPGFIVNLIHANICCKMFVGSNRMGFGPNVGSDCSHIFLHLVKISSGVIHAIYSM